jgi:hypothetical protein
MTEIQNLLKTLSLLKQEIIRKRIMNIVNDGKAKHIVINK